MCLNAPHCMGPPWPSRKPRPLYLYKEDALGAFGSISVFLEKSFLPSEGECHRIIHVKRLTKLLSDLQIQRLTLWECGLLAGHRCRRSASLAPGERFKPVCSSSRPCVLPLPPAPTLSSLQLISPLHRSGWFWGTFLPLPQGSAGTPSACSLEFCSTVPTGAHSDSELQPS